MSGAMGSHESHRALTTTWLTPPHILDALGPFDLDPCGHPDWGTARRRIVLPDDGLAVDWSGRVWLNPPYGREVWGWLAKLAAHGDGIALIFARTETEGFVREVWGKADAILFLARKAELPPGRRDARRGQRGGAVVPGGVRPGQRGRTRIVRASGDVDSMGDGMTRQPPPPTGDEAAVKVVDGDA